ncbi:MAG: hypothetical protein ACSHX8_05965 [Opitutaceae bacterium]
MNRGQIIYGGLTIAGLCIIVAGVLIPTVGTTFGCSNEGATKTQLSNYVTAVKMFKGEYGVYPELFESNSKLNLSHAGNSEKFIQVLSGRSSKGERVAAFGNRRQIGFHSFSEMEIEVNAETGYNQIVDRMGNPNVVICVDHDGDGIVEVMEDGSIKQIRTTVTAYIVPREEEKAIKLWD